MDEPLTEPTPIRETPEAVPELEVRGLGFGLSAAAVRALLDPATRGAAELVLDLSALSIRVPAAVVDEVLARLAPGVAAGLARGQVTIRPPDAPAIRVTMPAAGVRLRVDSDGLRIGDDDRAHRA